MIVLDETVEWPIIVDYSKAVDTIERTTVLEEAAKCAPAFTPLVSKWYYTRPTDALFRSDS